MHDYLSRKQWNIGSTNWGELFNDKDRLEIYFTLIEKQKQNLNEIIQQTTEISKGRDWPH